MTGVSDVRLHLETLSGKVEQNLWGSAHTCSGGGAFLCQSASQKLLKNKRSSFFAAKAQQPKSLGAKLGKFLLSLPGRIISLSALNYETIYN